MNRLASLLSILGLSAATYLSRLFYSMHAGTAGFKSFCNINEAFNCDLVTSTRYAELLPGLPLSSLVAGWFLALFFVSLGAQVTEWKKDAVRVGFAMSLIGSVYSIFLVVIMAGVLKTFCLFCLGIDVVNWALLFIFWRQMPKPVFGNLKPEKFGSYLSLIVGCLFIVTVLLRATSTGGEEGLTDTDKQYAVNQILSQPAVSLTPPESTVYLGNKDAKVTILEMSDFQCPHCQRGAFLVNSLLNLYGKEIRVGFLHFPLDSACNRQMKQPLHPFACSLARGAVCADKKGKFKDYYEGIFEDQDKLVADSGVNTLVKLGYTESEAKSCIDSEEAKKAISSQIEFEITLKIESTPTFYINGKKVEGAYPLDVWKTLIEKELAGK